MFKIEVSNNEEMCLTKAHSKGKFSKVFFLQLLKNLIYYFFLASGLFHDTRHLCTLAMSRGISEGQTSDKTSPLAHLS